MKSIAIIGGGPRGLSALENLCIEASKISDRLSFQIYLFEPNESLGNSFVYDIDQPNSNWINISERAMAIPSRPEVKFGETVVPKFPSYHEWAGLDFSIIDPQLPDTYPPRSKTGEYLISRFKSIQSVLEKMGNLKIIHEKVVKLSDQGNEIEIITEQSNTYNCSQALLAIGHQPNEDDDQLKEWKQSAKNVGVALFEKPYPIKSIIDKVNRDLTIAVRGFGLASIDVIRGVLDGLGYEFETDHSDRAVSLTKKGRHNVEFLPFSLDGLPMGPKPIHAEFDKEFELSESILKELLEELGKPKLQQNAKDETFILEEFIPHVADIYLNLKNPISANYSKDEIIEVLKKWTDSADFQHPLITNNSLSAGKLINQFIKIATQKASVSLDYCFGQVWRSFQPTFYLALSFSECSDETVVKVIAFDERIKRYSYGPPVESLQFLSCLVENKILNLSFVNNPEVECSKNGWELKNNEVSGTADIMVNAVLNKPQILKISSPIIKNLLDDDHIQPKHSKLGIEVDDNCFVCSESGAEIQLAVLGRIAKGTYIGVDAVLECFGERENIWAKKSVELLTR